MPIPNLSGATWPTQAEPDSVDFAIISAAANAYGVVSGCACTPGNSGVNLSVAVASGSAHVGSSTPVAVAGGTVTPGAAHATLPRFDLIVINTSGTASVTAGTAATAPEFPAIPASSTVLAAVYIPAAATAITAVNIVDKRQTLNRTPQLGTSSTTAAAGNHLHSGEYASTLHAATHAAAGSDQITTLGGFLISPNDGTGVLTLQGQTAANPGPVADDSKVAMYAHWLGYRPVPAVRSIDRWIPIGDEVVGPEHVWRVQPGTGTTAPITALEIPTTISGTTPTWSTPTATTALGYRQSMNTASSNGSLVAVHTTDARYVRGDNLLLHNGYYFHARMVFDHANGYTTSRIFLGLTDQTAATVAANADFAGHRHGFRISNGTGNWLMTTKDGTTEHTLDTGVAFATNAVFDFYIYVRPWGGYCFGHVINWTAPADSGSLIDFSSSLPGTGTYMRPMVLISTQAAAVRGMSFHRFGCEVAI